MARSRATSLLCMAFMICVLVFFVTCVVGRELARVGDNHGEKSVSNKKERESSVSGMGGLGRFKNEVSGGHVAGTLDHDDDDDDDDDHDSGARGGAGGGRKGDDDDDDNHDDDDDHKSGGGGRRGSDDDDGHKRDGGRRGNGDDDDDDDSRRRMGGGGGRGGRGGSDKRQSHVGASKRDRDVSVAGKQQIVQGGGSGSGSRNKHLTGGPN